MSRTATTNLLSGSLFVFVVAGERIPARASPRSMYDPGNVRVRM